MGGGGLISRPNRREIKKIREQADFEKENEAALIAALEFLKKELMPRLSSGFAGVLVTKEFHDYSHGWKSEQVIPFGEGATEDRTIARLLAKREILEGRKTLGSFIDLKFERQIFGDELIEVATSGRTGHEGIDGLPDLYLGSFVVAGIEKRRNDEAEYKNNAESWLRTGRCYEEGDGGFPLEYCDKKTYLQYKEEVSKLLDQAKKSREIDWGKKEIPEKLRKMVEYIKFGKIFPIPEGLDALECIEAMLNVPITQRKTGEEVRDRQRRDELTGHGDSYGRTTDKYYGTEGKIIVHQEVVQDSDSGCGQFFSYYITGVDIWSDVDPKEAANKILEVRYGKGADVSFFEALGSEEKAFGFIENFIRSVEKKKVNFVDSILKSSNEIAYEFSWKNGQEQEGSAESVISLARKLLEKFPNLKKRISIAGVKIEDFLQEKKKWD
ncbi:MAG: hypothetical protein V1664_03420 [Candidatus Uhrbacteria bacterium]